VLDSVGPRDGSTNNLNSRVHRRRIAPDPETLAGLLQVQIAKAEKEDAAQALRFCESWGEISRPYSP
jgi:hypothetical protein